MRQLASHAKTLRPNGSVRIICEDQPLNDFNALTRMIQGQAGPPPLYDQAHGIYVLAGGTSFYQPVPPPGCLLLGISATAMHWLSAKPTNIAITSTRSAPRVPPWPPLACKRRAIEKPFCWPAPPNWRPAVAWFFVTFAKMGRATIWAATAGCRCLPPFARFGGNLRTRSGSWQLSQAP